jgi:hypothetical protein
MNKDNSRVSQWARERELASLDDKNMQMGPSLWYVTASLLLSLRWLNCFESTDRELIRRISGMGNMPGDCLVARGL